MIEKNQIKKEKPSIGFGVTSFVIGLIAFILSAFFYFSIPLGVLSIIFFSIQRKIKPTGLATTGLVLSILALIFGAIWGVIMLIAVSIGSLY